MKRILLAVYVLAALLPRAQAQAAQRCFADSAPDIHDCIDGRIAEFWDQNGGLAVFGYPIGAQQSQTIEGRDVQVQVFERNRLELHPENAAPYDVLLGRLGVEALAQQGRDWNTFDKGSATAPHYFAETGHAIAEQFWPYWSSHGLNLDGRAGTSQAESLALFGLPISEATQETSPTDGKTYLTQWFERARFELHPENAGTPYEVQLGLLSRELGGSAASSLPPGGFIQVSGSQLTRQGQPVTIKGINYYPQWRPWSDMWRQWDGPQAARELELAHDQLGVNAVRVLLPYNFTGRDDDDGKVTPLLVSRLREMAQIASDQDMRLIVTLFDFYKSFSRPGTNDEQHDFTYLRDLLGNFVGDERIMAWDIHNEPDHYGRWQAGEQQRVLAWLGRMADEVHRIAPDQLVTVGMGEYQNLLLAGPDGRRPIDYSDVVSIHMYDAGAAQQSLATIRASTSKPILFEEFGWPTGPRCLRNYSEKVQADLYRDVLAAARQYDAGVVAWTLRDYDAGATDRWDSFEEHFGLFRPDDSLKPAAELLRGFAAAPLPSALKTDLPLTSTNPQLPGGDDGPLLVPGTTLHVKGVFRRAWELYGGQESFGLPLTEAYTRPDDRMVVQYFERAVIEMHDFAKDDPVRSLPESERLKYVLVPLDLGVQFGGGHVSGGSHAISPTFQPFYDRIIGAWRLGTPISDELVEQIGGVDVTVQYFQRGRLERGADGTIQVSQLGSQALEAQCQQGQP